MAKSNVTTLVGGREFVVVVLVVFFFFFFSYLFIFHVDFCEWWIVCFWYVEDSFI